MGLLEVCLKVGRVGSSVPSGRPATLALPDGDFLVVLSQKQGWGILRLSRDGRTLRGVAADVQPGQITGAVLTDDGGVLVTAEEGLFRLGAHARIERIADCDETGQGRIVADPDGSALAFPNGDLLLAAEHDLLRVSLDGRLERMGELPAGTSAFQIVADDAVLASGVFGAYLLGPGGRLTPVAIGALAQSLVVARGVAPHMRGSIIDAGMMSAFGITQPLGPGVAWVDALGRVAWAIPPRDVKAHSEPIELADGRIFWLTDRGLLRARKDGTVESVSDAVGLACNVNRPDVRQLTDGRALVLGWVVFTIDPDDRVATILSKADCAHAPGERDVAATSDARVYFVKDNALYRVDPDGRVVAIPAAEDTGRVRSLRTYGTDLLLEAEEGVFYVHDGRLERIAPKGHMVNLLYHGDLEGRPLVCVDRNSLQRLDSRGHLQPLTQASGVPCRAVAPVGSVALLTTGEGQHQVLMTRDDRAIEIPAARVWPIADLHDGSVVVLAMPVRRPDKSWWELAPEEQAAIPRSLVRVSLDGRLDRVRFEGPEIDLKPPRDPRWLERRKVSAVQFVSPTRGWAVFGERGILATTSDAGVRWRGVRSGSDPIEGLSSLSFTADGRHGIAAGKHAIWRTDDAGASWTRIPWSTRMLSVSRVVLLGAEGVRAYAVADEFANKQFSTQLLLSDDGGRRWAPQTLPLPASAGSGFGSFATVGFDSSGRNGWLVDADRLLTTSDAGNTWQLKADLRDYREVEASRWRFELPTVQTMFGQVMQHLPVMPVAVAYWGPGAPWCIARGKLFCMFPVEGRAREETKEIETEPDVAIASISVAPDGKHGWAVGTVGTILATEDGGKNWLAQNSHSDGVICCVFFLPDALHGWVWGEDGFMKTVDGGRNWQSLGRK